MEDRAMASEKQESSYTYWVRGATQDAAPAPLPRKLTAEDLSSQPKPAALGSLWNRAGTWEEKNLNKWSADRIKELLKSVGSLELREGRAEITDVSKCIGDAYVVTVRNKKRAGYTFELTLKIKGEWNVGGENKTVKANIDIAEFSFGDLDDLQMEVQLTEDKHLLQPERLLIKQELKLFLQPVREKLLQFEEELKDR